MQITNQCPSCGSEKLQKLRNYRFQFPGEAVHAHLADLTYERLWILFERILKDRTEVEFHAGLCGECGLIFTNPRFSPEDFQRKYEAIVELGSVKHREQANPATNLAARAQRVYALIERYLRPGAHQPAVLDYGGASGYILAPFVKSCECGVLDYVRWDLPPGIRYLGRDLADLPGDKKFDVILLLHTLEHVLEPQAFLQGLCQALKEDGMLYVEVPLGCFREWNGLREPLTHINFFSEESLANCLKRCGLSVIHISTSYQWVTHGKSWCLNIIGSKRPRADLPAPVPLSTRQQMNKPAYYLPLVSQRLVGKVLRRVGLG